MVLSFSPEARASDWVWHNEGPRSCETVERQLVLGVAQSNAGVGKGDQVRATRPADSFAFDMSLRLKSPLTKSWLRPAAGSAH